MDLWNNKMGREIGNKIKESSNNKIVNPLSSEVKDEIAIRIIEYMRVGKLILDPNGRKTPLKSLNIDKKSEASNLNSSSSCVGSYPVSSYTRSDGTKVSAYTRTCGAKHERTQENIDKERYSKLRFQDIQEDEIRYALSLFV